MNAPSRNTSCLNRWADSKQQRRKIWASRATHTQQSLFLHASTRDVAHHIHTSTPWVHKAVTHRCWCSLMTGIIYHSNTHTHHPQPPLSLSPHEIFKDDFYYSLVLFSGCKSTKSNTPSSHSSRGEGGLWACTPQLRHIQIFAEWQLHCSTVVALHRKCVGSDRRDGAPLSDVFMWGLNTNTLHVWWGAAGVNTWCRRQLCSGRTEELFTTPDQSVASRNTGKIHLNSNRLIVLCRSCLRA